MNAWRIALWALVVALIIAFLWAVRGVLPPFLLALVISAILEPAVRWLRRKGVARPLAVCAVLVTFFAVIVGAALLIAPYASQQYGQAKGQIQSIYGTLTSSNPDQAMAGFDHMLAKNRGLLSQFHLPTTRQGLVDAYVTPNRLLIENQTKKFVTGGVVSIIAVASQAFMLFFTPLLVFGMLIDLESMRRALARFIPPTIRPGALSMLGDMGAVFQAYLRGLVANVTLYTLVIGLVLGVVGAPYYLVLAVMAGVLYLIPIIGAIIASIIIFFVIGLSGQARGHFFGAESSWGFALYAVLILAVVGTLYDSLVTPRIVGRAVKLNPVLSAFVVFSAGALFQLPGMLLAYPVAGAIKVVLDRLVRFTGASEGELKLPATPLRHRQLAEA